MVRKASGSRVYDEPEPGDILFDMTRGEELKVSSVSDNSVELEDAFGTEKHSKKSLWNAIEDDILKFR